MTPNGFISVPFLLDTGAQCSIIDFDLLSNCTQVTPESKPILSLGMNRPVDGYSIQARLALPGTGIIEGPIFGLPSLKLNISIPQMSSHITKLKDFGVPLSHGVPEYPSDSLIIRGILGNDWLDYFSVFELTTCQGFRMLRLSDGFVPIGDISKVNCSFHKSANYSKFKRIKSSSNPPYGNNYNVPLNNKFDLLSSHSDMNTPAVCSGNIYPETPRCNCYHSYYKLPRKGFNNSHSVNKKQRKTQKYSKEPQCTKTNVVPARFRQAVAVVLNPKSPENDSCINEGLDEDIFKRLHDLETLGIPSSDISDPDEKAIQQFKDNIQLREGKYHVDIPWKEDVLRRVPSNLELCKIIARKVSHKNGELDGDYLAVFNEQKQLGIIEEIPPGFNPNNHKFIPHRPIVRTDPLVNFTKIRPVFNCSLKIGKQPSLNDATFPGVDMLNSLLGLLVYFRANKHVLLADIEKAFLQIKLNKESDKNCFSFCLCENGKIKYYRYNSIIFGFVTSPFILNYILKFHSESTPQPLKDLLSNKFYMDNLIVTSQDEESLLEIGQQLNSSMADVGLNLREWNSNSHRVFHSLSNEPLPQESKVLGYVYSSKNDILQIKNVSLDPNCNTKRKVLSAVASIFDPLGLVTPLLIPAKLFLREICKSHYSWDGKLSEVHTSSWAKIAKNFSLALEEADLAIPRSIANSSDPAELIVFSDASTKCYGVTMYLVQNGKSNLLFSKCKLAPEPTKTLPSLELLAVYLAFKCVKSIILNTNFPFNISCVRFLMDSQVALNWVISEKVNKKNIFVNNRIKEITEIKKDLSNFKLSYHFVPTEHNIADILTKPLSSNKFVNLLPTWLNGPDWITKELSFWPKGTLGCLPSPKPSVENGLFSSAILPVINNNENFIFPIDKFSSYHKLLAVTMNIFKAKSLFLKQPIDSHTIKKQAFLYIFKTMQSQCFEDELTFLLSNNLDIDSAPSNVQNLNMFLDKEGLIRSRGRIAEAKNLTFDAIHPIVVPKNHHIANLLIKNAHTESHHLGVESTLNKLRQSGFWMLQARTSVKRVLKSCIICNKYNNRAFIPPKTPALPSDRVNYAKPFQHTGIDYTGHFFVKNQDIKSKVYILIFTCMNTRYVHLELVNSMSLDEFILAFVRFYNRFGFPQVLYSDNARTFASGSALISELIATDTFQREFIKYNMTHKPIPVYSPWYGACWERLIKTVKLCLYKTIGRISLTATQFATILSDIQVAINNRPLTFVDRQSSLDALTPSDLVSPSSHFPTLIITDIQRDDCEPIDDEQIRLEFVNTLERRDIILDKFSRDWYSAYLLSLRPSHRDSFQPTKPFPKFLKVGSIVLVKHPIKPRPYWTLARIMRLLPGPDGRVRVVEIRNSSGGLAKINISNLYPLELESPGADEEAEKPEHLPPQPSDNIDVNNVNNFSASSAEEPEENPLNPPNEENLSFSEKPAHIQPPRRAAARFRKNLQKLVAEGSL